jgi:integrase
MKKQMAHPAGMLVRKDGNIRFQYRIPKDLQQYYPRAVMSENLGTSDKTLAARIIHKRKAELEHEFARHRAPRAAELMLPRRASISDSEATNLAKTMLASVTKADEEIRHEGLSDEVFAPESFVATRSPLSREAIKQAAAKGDYTHFTEVVSDWLVGHGYDLEPGSSDFRKVAREFAKASHQALEIVSKRDTGEFVDTPVPPVMEGMIAPASALNPASSGPTLSLIVQHFLDSYDKTAAMFKKHRAALALLVESIGDIPVSDIRQLHIDSYFDLLCRLPPRWADEVRQKGISVKELAKLDHPLTLSPKTFEYSYMASIRPFLAEAKRLFGDNGFPRHLTVEGIKYKGNQKEGARKQRAFTEDELKRLFEGAEYAAFAADPSQAAQYWLPLIGLYTGARVNEVCQVNPQCDVQEEEGIWFFDFNEESASDERVTKSVKTAGSRRKTPIHSKLLELGLMKYVDRMKKQGSTLLFPQWIPTRGRASPAGEDWFRQFLAETGLRDETHGRTLLGMHAFRHTLMNYGFNNHIANVEVITGHVGEASRVVRGYRGEMALPNKKIVVEKLNFDVDPPKPKADL